MNKTFLANFLVSNERATTVLPLVTKVIQKVLGTKQSFNSPFAAWEELQSLELFRSRTNLDGRQFIDCKVGIGMSRTNDTLSLNFHKLLNRLFNTTFTTMLSTLLPVWMKDRSSSEYNKKFEVVWVKTDLPGGMELTARPGQVIRADEMPA